MIHIESGVYNLQNKIVPKWIIVWLISSMLIVLWDVTFVLFRPLSFSEILWLPYTKYILIDKSYADLNNAFVITQAIMSLMEILIGIIGVFYYYLNKLKIALLLIFSTQLLTGTKTTLIFLLEIVGGFKYTGHNSNFELIFYYFLPNSIWIVLPLIVVFVLGRSLLSR